MQCRCLIVPLGIAFCSLAAVIFFNRSAKSAEILVGRTWPATQQISIDQVSHDAWDALLKKYVDDRGDVNYTDWKASAEDVATLDSYLDHLSEADPRRRASREALLAYWINAYNAVTIKGILREYPTTSIRNHTAKVFGYNIWKHLLLVTPAGNYSLDQIEHSILRKLNEHRIHFAIVCASRSCPRLLNEGCTAERIEEQLNANAAAFFSDGANFRYDVASRRLWVSSILKWFAEDFGANTAEQMKTISPYISDPAARRLAASGTATVSYLDYDWGLNDQKARKASRE